MLLGKLNTYSQLAPYGGDRSSTGKANFLKKEEQTGFCMMPRSNYEMKEVATHLAVQERRLDAMSDALEAKGDFYEDIRQSVADMSEELDQISAFAGQQKARANVAKATQAVLHLTDTFDMLDMNASGSIDVAELRRGLHHLGMDSHSAQANAIIERYTHNQTIDVKVFTTLVKDIHMLLSFDVDGSGTLDASELKPALAKLGLTPSDRNIEKIARAWDADNSGKLDLLEFTDLVRTVKTFMKYDLDESGDIDVAELRPALRRLGIPADTATANAVLKWYDHDDSGRIELHEFAVLARDASVFATFDRDHSGSLDEAELLPALAKLGLAASEKEVRDIISAWDDNGEGTINLLEFAEIIRDLQVFEQFDVDRSGFISTAELGMALGKLGVHLSHPETKELLVKYDADQSGTIEFSEFRALAEDLPSLVGREKGSFFKLHHGDSAYVHAEDVLDDAIHVDLDQTFKKVPGSLRQRSMSDKKRREQREISMKLAGGSVSTQELSMKGSVLGKAGGSVLGTAGGSVLGAAGAPPPTSILGAAAPTAGANPFDSRMFGAGGALARQAKQDPTLNVRGARLLHSEKPTLHQSKNMVRD